MRISLKMIEAQVFKHVQNPTEPIVGDLFSLLIG